MSAAAVGSKRSGVSAAAAGERRKTRQDQHCPPPEGLALGAGLVMHW